MLSMENATHWGFFENVSPGIVWVINPARLADRKRPHYLVLDNSIFTAAIDLHELVAFRALVGSVFSVVGGNTALEFLVVQEAHQVVSVEQPDVV
jgi:hypothetical protein